jgi:hypothetical protein
MIYEETDNYKLEEPDKKEDTAKKFDNEKIRMDLLPVRALTGIAEVLTHGAKKYGDRNWENGLKWSRVFGATLRHLFAWWGGEDIDKESGLHHLKHVGCNILFLLEFIITRKDLDDRPNKAKDPIDYDAIKKDLTTI